MNCVPTHSRAPSVLVAHGGAAERGWLSTLLSSSGFQVTSHDNGEDALRSIRSKRFDLVLTAVSMPHSDGLEVIRTVMERHAGTPVIAMGSADPIEQIYLRSAAALGASTTYTMPVAADALLDGVRAALHGVGPKLE